MTNLVAFFGGVTALMDTDHLGLGKTFDTSVSLNWRDKDWMDGPLDG